MSKVENVDEKNSGFSENDKPLLLLDIDGVLNAYGRTYLDADAAERQHDDKYYQAVAEGYLLFLHKNHAEYVEELESRFEVMWATMWQWRAPRFGEVAGYGQSWDFINFDLIRGRTAQSREIGMRGAGVGSYKWPGVLHTAADRPFVWIDDDLEPWQHAWAEERHRAGTGTLFIQPNIWEGLTREHVNTAVNFADSLMSQTR